MSIVRHLRRLEDTDVQLAMYMTASLIVERVSGMPFIQFVHDRILAPLGVQMTYNETAADLTGLLGQGFALTALNASDGGEGWTKSIHRATSFWLHPSSKNLMAGPGGVLASAKDMVSCDLDIRNDWY